MTKSIKIGKVFKLFYVILVVAIMSFTATSYYAEADECNSYLSAPYNNVAIPLSTGNISGGGNDYFSGPGGGKFTFNCSGKSAKADVRFTLVSSSGSPSYYVQLYYKDISLFTIPVLTLNGNGVYHFTTYGPDGRGLEAGEYTVIVYSDGISGFSAAAYIEDYYSVYGHD